MIAEKSNRTSRTKKPSNKKPKINEESFSFSSTFNWEQANLKEILKPIDFYIVRANDEIEPFNHFHHKNLHYNSAPFMDQCFLLYLDNLTNIKYIGINNYTHGSEMTISIALEHGSAFQEVYKDKYVCKGKTLKQERKNIDIGALPCKALKIEVQKGSKICSRNISLLGMDSLEIEEKFGSQYFKLMVQNPIKIIYP